MRGQCPSLIGCAYTLRNSSHLLVTVKVSMWTFQAHSTPYCHTASVQ
jgi:hypothetical protein